MVLALNAFIKLLRSEFAASSHPKRREAQEPGPAGVIFVVSDDHPGLKSAIAQVLPEALWQRYYVHFLRNTLDYLPRRKADDDCRTELRWFYERRNVEEARRDLTARLAKWQGKYPQLSEWVENNIEETFTFCRLPKEHHKHLKSTNAT
jgi:putative transposase